MPVPIAIKDKVQEALKLIDVHRESYSTLAKRFGVGKATVYRWHIDRLSNEIEARKREMVELEGKLKVLHSDFASIEGKYRKKTKVLDEEYKKKKSVLEGEIEKLKRETEAIKACFKARGLSWEQGIAIVKGVSDLTEEAVNLQNKVSELKTQFSSWSAKANRMLTRVGELTREREDLQGAVRTYTKWLGTEGPRIEGYKARLEGSVIRLENQKRGLQLDVNRIKQSMKQLQLEEEGKRKEIKRLETAKHETVLAVEKEIKRGTGEKEKLVRQAKECIKKANERAEKIVADAKREKACILREVQGLRKEKEKLQAEQALIETAVKMKVEEFKEARKRLEEEEAERETGEDMRTGPVGNLLSHIPKLQPIKTVKREK